MLINKKLPFIALHCALILFCNLSFAQKKVSHFKAELDFGNGTVLSTFLDVKIGRNQFSITSPKDADVRIYGNKAKLGRIMGKSPKKGIIITIAGEQKNDSLFGEAKVPMIGKLKFKGIVNDEIVSGDLFDKEGNPFGTVKGSSSSEYKIDYDYLYPIMIKTVEEHIYSTSVLQTEDWKKFKKELERICHVAHDDIELYFGFNILSQQLPFSHLSFSISQDVAKEEEEEQSENTSKAVVFEEKNTTTAYLLIKNFSTTTDELAAVLPTIIANQNYKNLIIDLRNNPGGGIEAAFEFAKYITQNGMEVGYFLTNKLKYSGFQPELFQQLPELQPKGTEDFIDELKASPGVKMIFNKPNNPVFSGNIYVLTNGNTASTCEPIVYTLKKSKRATIVGEKTYGGMLAASPFVVSGKYMLILPIADFYTTDGVRLDRVGVDPDIETKSDDALDKVMELINNAKS